MNSIDTLKRLAPLSLPESMWLALEAAYATPPRAYHTLEHIVDVAQHFSRVRWARPSETFLAVLWHDAVYVVGAHDNEERSADFFERHWLLDPSTPLEVNRVRELILLTARHGHLRPYDVDSEAAQFLDCDMAILGSDPDTFFRYELQISQEYLPLFGEEAYRLGRRAFLQKLLDSPRIFLSEHFHQLLDARARKNLGAAFFLPAPSTPASPSLRVNGS